MEMSQSLQIWHLMDAMLKRYHVQTILPAYAGMGFLAPHLIWINRILGMVLSCLETVSLDLMMTLARMSSRKM